MTRSRINIYEQYENASIRHVEAVIDNCIWKFRSRQEKDNDIDGEIEVFDEGITTAKIIKVQLKASLEIEIKDNFVIYDCPVKFLHFCDVCDVPILLVYYSVTDKKAYWLWTQMHIFKELNVNKADWRNNRGKVRLKIPIENEFTFSESFKGNIKKIADNGINEIQQLRKQDTSEYYYTILEEIDNSSIKNRRISAKVYIEKSLASSKEATMELIKKINKKVRTSTYHKKVLSEKSEQREIDAVWLFLYDDLIQYKISAPFCRTEWINTNAKDIQKSVIGTPDVILDEAQIKIKWETIYTLLNEYFTLNTVSKGEYLKGIKRMINYVQIEAQKVCDLFYKDRTQFYQYANQKRDEYRNAYLEFGELPSPPFECTDLHSMLEESVSTLDNMTDSLVEKSGNDYYLESQFIKNITKNVEVLSYLITKVIR